MKFEEFGKEIENVTISVSPLDLAERNMFDVLNLLLKKIKDKKPEFYQKFVNAITNKLQKKTGNKHLKKESERLSKKISQYENLSESFELVRLHLNYMNETLGITEDQLWQNEKTAFPSENFMTSLYVLFYIHLMTLIELLGRKKGIEFYRESIDNYNEKINAINQKDIFTDLSDMREQLSKSLKKNPYGRIRLFSEVKDGQLIKICKNCEKFTGLQNTELTSDSELFYNVLCYMHIPLAKVWNDNFVLNIEKSLALGDLYCVYVYFDTRIAKEIVQLSDEYLDEIWSKYKQ